MKLLTGWAGRPRSAARVRRPADPQDVLAESSERGVIARGLGRSYGDAALNAGGIVEEMTALAGVRAFDVETGIVTVAAGTSLDALVRRVLPFGWFPPVVPGTRFVTIGGAIAADVHGKNHVADGSFCTHVARLVLRTPDGEDRVLTPGSEGFRATAGGMGLTGTVVEATLALRRVETARVIAHERRTRDLGETLEALDEGARHHGYAVAWIDLLRRSGRGIVSVGDHAGADEVASGRTSLEESLRPPRTTAPEALPSGMLTTTVARAFNEAWYRRVPASPRWRSMRFEPFFFPLDAVGRWNRAYGPRGFVQYQLAVPTGEEATIAEVARRLAAARCPSFLTVLKRLGPGRGMLSFPIEGWTLACDIPAGVTGLRALLRGLDELVAAVGGRVYLAKDGRLAPDMLAAMYPELDQWREARAQLDPGRVLRSDLARRLGL